MFRNTLIKRSDYTIPMQQLETSKQIVEAEQRFKRMGKGRVIAQSRRIYRLLQTEDVFYVESESTDNVYYFVKYKPDVIEFCSCPIILQEE